MWNSLTTVAVGAVTFLALIIFGATLVRAVFYAPTESDLKPSVGVEQTTPPSEHPARLQIPVLGIDADVQHVGVNENGNMGVPSNYTDVAWYKYGTVPGQIGSAVIDGHVDNGLGLSGVFKHLGDLKPGDDVYIVTKEGAKLHFKVSSIATYPYKSVPAELLFSRKDGAWLNLITCGGKWVKSDKTYNQRIVVFTKLVR